MVDASLAFSILAPIISTTNYLVCYIQWALTTDAGEQAAFKFEKLLLIEPRWQAQKYFLHIKSVFGKFGCFMLLNYTMLFTNNNPPKLTPTPSIKKMPPLVLSQFLGSL